MFAFRHSRPCHAVPCPHRAHAWAPGEPGRRPGWQPGTSSLCAWCPVGRSAGGCSRVGRPKATELGPSPAPASMVNPPGTINPLAWLIPCALALLAELGGLGVPGGPHSHHPCPGLHPAGTYRLLGAVAARLPRVCVIADLDFVGRHPVVPAWGRGSVGSRTCPPPGPPGLALPGALRPDGVEPLCDDAGEVGEPAGIHLQPLLRVLLPRTPAAVVEVPVIEPRLWVVWGVSEMGRGRRTLPGTRPHRLRAPGPAVPPWQRHGTGTRTVLRAARALLGRGTKSGV